MVNLWYAGFGLFLVSAILWSVTVLQANKRSRTDLIPQMWMLNALMWVGFIIMRISR